jgi:hypothetical protein
MVALPGSGPAGSELLAAVLDHLGRFHPGLVLSPQPPGLHPVDAAARLVQEDLCLMEREMGKWVLTAASVCFASRWDLPSKLGRDLSGIHQPVPGFAEKLAAPVDAFFDRLRVDRPVWRLNWTLLDSPELHQPDAAGRSTGSAPLDPGRDLWFRVERQTLRRLSERPAVTFTIRTYVTRLGELVSTHPEVAGALRVALPTVPAATVAYKGWSGLVGPVLAWLDDQVSKPSASEGTAAITEAPAAASSPISP